MEPLNNHTIRIAIDLWKYDRQASDILYGPIGEWDVSGVTNMDDLFRSIKGFNENLRNWDVSNVTSMLDIFLGTNISYYNIKNWNVANVKLLHPLKDRLGNVTYDGLQPKVKLFLEHNLIKYTIGVLNDCVFKRNFLRYCATKNDSTSSPFLKIEFNRLYDDCFTLLSSCIFIDCSEYYQFDYGWQNIDLILKRLKIAFDKRLRDEKILSKIIRLHKFRMLFVFEKETSLAVLNAELLIRVSEYF